MEKRVLPKVREETVAARPNTHAALPLTQAVAAQVLSGAFVELDLSAALLDGNDWSSIHGVSRAADVVMLELGHGVERRRTSYNRRAVQHVRREGKIFIGEHAGFHDLFVPVGDIAGSWGMLVMGPFALTRPTVTEVTTRWRWMTGRNARASDLEFRRYLSTTLAVLTLDGPRLGWFRGMVQCLARILAGQGPVDRLAHEASVLREKLRETRTIERMWSAAREMIDESAWRNWQSPYRIKDLAQVGADQVPEHALVGLMVARDHRADPIEGLLRRHAFQRACAELARRRGEMLCGRLQGHGVVFLVNERGSRARAKLIELGQRATSLAQRHDLQLSIGASHAASPANLPERFRAALFAAERALTQGSSPIFAEPRGGSHPKQQLGELRRDLAAAVSENPTVLGPRFERYLEAVAVHCAYGIDATRAHLEVGFDEIMSGLRATGAMDDRNLSELAQALESSATDANTVRDLSEAYRKSIADIELALKRPLEARQDRGLARAITYIHGHFSEALALPRLARIAGFAPGYFSKLFAKSENMTLREYTQRLRIERAKRMLVVTGFSAERVGQLCGFHARNRFYVAFRRLEGITPTEYRKREADRPHPRGHSVGSRKRLGASEA